MTVTVIRASNSHRRRIQQAAPAAPADYSLLNNLIACWPGDEASGNLIDAHTNELDVSDMNTVTNNTGLVYATARQYTAANYEYHYRPADEALLSMGDVDFTLAAWAYLDSKTASRAILSKWNSATSTREYALYYLQASDRWRFLVSKDGTAETGELADALGSPSLSTWYLVIAWHDAVNNTINIQVNNGDIDSQGHTFGVFDGTARLAVGSLRGVSASATFNGRIGPTAIWKSAAAGGGVLTPAHRTALYNNGAGLAYSEFTT